MKVLVVMNASNISLGGGIIQVVLNYFDALKNENSIKMDFAMNLAAGCEFSGYVRKFGSDFYQLPNKKEKFFSYIKELKRILKNDYDVIHVHASSSTMCIELIIALIAKVPVRIAHCHNSTCTHIIIAQLLKPILKKTYTDAVACSKLAGEWLFGKDNFIVLHNAVDTEKFKFNYGKREIYRNKMGVENCFVIGHVGRFNDQKNHLYLIHIFERIVKTNANARLLLIGDGPDLEKITQKIRNSPAYKQIILYGESDDVSGLLSAMDVFAFPSKFEGFGIAIVEAQISGLPCVVSDAVPKDIILSNQVDFLAINNSDVDSWVREINKYQPKQYKRGLLVEQHLDTIKTFDIKDNLKQLKKLYALSIHQNDE